MELNIEITGYKSEITDLERLMTQIRGLSQGCTIQLLNADGIAGAKHALQATTQAIMAFERGENMAKDLGLEICVRASAQRQISRALKLLGLDEGENRICAVFVGCEENILNEIQKILGKRDDNILIPDETVLKRLYGISDSEIEIIGSLERVMMERTALLATEI